MSRHGRRAAQSVAGHRQRARSASAFGNPSAARFHHAQAERAKRTAATWDTYDARCAEHGAPTTAAGRAELWRDCWHDNA